MQVSSSIINSSVDRVASAVDAAKRSANVDSATVGGENVSVARSPELARLMSLLKNQPEVRDDVLNQVRVKIAAGELDSQSAVAEAAAGIVDSDS